MLTKRPSPPIAESIDTPLTIHGDTRIDPYYWLRDDNRQNEAVLHYLNAENDYTKACMADTEALQEQLYQEMTERLEPNDTSVPVFYKGYWRWSQFVEGKDYRINIRQKGSLDAPHEVILDQNDRAEGYEYYHLGGLGFSPDQRLQAIAEDFVSRRQYDIRIKDFTTGEYFDEVIANTSGNFVWAADNKTLFYTKLDEQTLLPFQVYRHTVGTDVSQDVLIYQEPDNTFYLQLFKTRSERYIGIHVQATESSEVRFLAADNPTGEFKIFYPREAEHLYEVEHLHQHFYILSDKNAPNNRLLKASDDGTGSVTDLSQWQEIVPHKDDTLLQEFELFDQAIVLHERVEGCEQIIFRDLDGQKTDQIQFDEEVYSIELYANPDPSATTLRYYYSSLTTPDSVFEYDCQSRKTKLLKQDKVLGEFNPDNYHAQRIMVSARDGVKVPVSLVYRKDKFHHDGTNPLLNYAYGSYGIVVDAEFNIALLSLLDRGFVYAISHVRGSKMLGRHWYESGKKLTKLNTFYDFIDCTKALIEQQFGDPKRIYAQGGSAGGMLMGGVVNMAPELYHGVIAAVPFVDVVTTMLDESIPLTTGEYDEWGNPNDKAYYDYMLSYSPYDQVRAQDYPNLLVITGLHDSQVQYWEPAKWVAKLRATKTDDNLLLLDTDMDAGHGGKSGRYKAFVDLAKEWAFLIDLAGAK